MEAEHERDVTWALWNLIETLEGHGGMEASRECVGYRMLCEAVEWVEAVGFETYRCLTIVEATGATGANTICVRNNNMHTLFCDYVSALRAACDEPRAARMSAAMHRMIRFVEDEEALSNVALECLAL